MDINYGKSKEKVVNPVDLSIIERKIAENAYQCFEAFYSDIKWLAHNIKVHRSGKSNHDFKFFL